MSILITSIVGSQLYKLTTSKSDTDLVIITSNPEQIEEQEGKDIEVFTVEEFQSALDSHKLKAIEAYFSNLEAFKAVGINFKLDTNKLRRSVSATVSNSHVKAKKKIRIDETYIGLKSYWHCHRILYQMTELATNQSYNPEVTDPVLISCFSDIMSYLDYTETEEDEIFKLLTLTHDKDLKAKLTAFRLLCPLE